MTLACLTHGYWVEAVPLEASTLVVPTPTRDPKCDVCAGVFAAALTAAGWPEAARR